MMLRGLLVAVVVGFVAGCAVAERVGAVNGNGRLVVATMPAAREGVDPANRFSRDVFEYEGRAAGERSALTEGWVERAVKFEVQHPYDLKLGERWSYDASTDTQDLWVLGTDTAHMPPPNRTTARTELRLIDPEYKGGTGMHMMECDLFIEPGTFAAITQVFATGPMAMIVVDPKGTITDLGGHNAVLATGMNGRWFHWTVVHDSNASGRGAIKVYVDGKMVGEMAARRSESFYFKVGIYSRHGSERSEVKVRDLRVWWKGPAAK